MSKVIFNHKRDKSFLNYKVIQQKKKFKIFAFFTFEYIIY